MSRDRAALDAALLDAHHRGNLAALVQLYDEAGTGAEAAGDPDAACFYWTHAYIFALEAGDPAALGLRDRLRGYGREK